MSVSGHSHGHMAYGQPGGEAYGMREMQPQAQAQAGGWDYDPYSAAGVGAGAAGIGTRAAYGQYVVDGGYGQNDAGTGYGQHDASNGYGQYDSQNAYQYSTGTTSNAYDYTPNSNAPTRQPSSSYGHYSSNSGSGPGVDAAVGLQRGISLSHNIPSAEPAYDYAYPPHSTQVQTQPPVHEEEDHDAYGGFVVDPDQTPSPGRAGDDRGSYYDVEVPRALRIANE
ncbi:hypothetical protein H0H92_013474 [Tricholoma furcatifolium]|nr:hypothetical protein H0H92_013474 [Tricholoma furcatifolium]